MSQPVRTISPLATVLNRWHVVVVLAALLYGGLHLLWYWQTPLGQAPVLDERENLDLAAQIASGTLAPEPFYRAMGYPLLLSSGYALGIPANLMPFYSTGLGLGLHILNSLLVAVIAFRLFKKPTAALIAGLAHGLNPVLVHYATQILDGAWATTWFLLGTVGVFLSRPGATRPRLAAAAASVCWATATLIRPQFLTLWAAFPLVWWFMSGRSRPVTWTLTTVAVAMAAGSIPWLAQGMWQRTVSGEFRLMPTQGAYNLWAANRPGANGAYFVQQIHLAGSGEIHRNPTRVESEVLFVRNTGRSPTDIDEMNTHWSRRLRASILAEPVGWLRLVMRKTYLLFSNTDQYNNKTYAFHQARSPALRYNPLGWGVLLLTATIGWITLWPRDRAAVSGLLLIAAATATGILLGFVSGRFRAPLLPWLCIGAGGLVFLREWMTQSHGSEADRPSARSGYRLVALCGGLLFVGTLTFSNFADARSTRTFIQDHLLIASSAVAVGDDAIAWNESGAALALEPNHPDALAWRVTSYFNLLLSDKAAPADEPAWLEAAERTIQLPDSVTTATARTTAALARWRGGEQAGAVAAWRRWVNTEGSPDALAALILAGESTPSEQAVFARQTHNAPSRGLIRLARAAMKLESTPQTPQLVEAAQRLFAAKVSRRPTAPL